MNDYTASTYADRIAGTCDRLASHNRGDVDAAVPVLAESQSVKKARRRSTDGTKRAARR